MRICRAKIPEKYVIETFPFNKQPKLARKNILNIYDSDYISKNQNIIWVGSTGTGKTGLATSFLMQTINQGYRGRFISFSELVEMLYRSVADHTEAKMINTFVNYDCLLIDELGYVEVEPVQVGLFFTLMQKRHKKKSTLITSNLGFSQWTSFLKNDQLTAALIDRLTENSHIINMKNCVSLRPKLSRA
jgi:DNA replication protein DnaC